MPYRTWSPKRGAPTTALAALFDFFLDANRFGYPNAEDLTALGMTTMPDETGNNHHAWADGPAAPSGVVQNDPSVDFGAANASLGFTQLGYIVVRENEPGDTISDVPHRITPLLGRGSGGETPQAVTFVAVASFGGLPLPFLTPYGYDGAIDLDAHLFGITGGDWTTGSANNTAGSNTAADTDPHLFIVESGTATSGVEVDGVAGDLTDLAGAGIQFPDLWRLSATSGELLFLGVKVGTFAAGEKQLIRGWVAANTPIVIT